MLGDNGFTLVFDFGFAWRSWPSFVDCGSEGSLILRGFAVLFLDHLVYLVLSGFPLNPCWAACGAKRDLHRIGRVLLGSLCGRAEETPPTDAPQLLWWLWAGSRAVSSQVPRGFLDQAPAVAKSPLPVLPVHPALTQQKTGVSGPVRKESMSLLVIQVLPDVVRGSPVWYCRGMNLREMPSVIRSQSEKH